MVSAPIRSAVVESPGIPSAAIGIMEPPIAALLEHSDAHTPSGFPLPKSSGCLDAFFAMEYATRLERPAPESLKGYENPIETMDENTQVKIEIDPEKLYYNMVEAKAEWLYNLPQWDSILSEEKRKELYKQQKASGTVRKAKKVFPNDPCPCGSGKKYKQCCGRKPLA